MEFPRLDLEQAFTVEKLPAMPQVAVHILQLSQNPDAGPADYARLIEADAGLTLQVLRFVNSSYFGFPNKISNVQQAITLIGVRAIKNFILYNAVYSMTPNPKCVCLDLRKLWQDSLRRALFARTMGQMLGMENAEEPFAAALLQDMAVPLLAKEVPQAYETLLGARDQSEKKVRLSQLEERAFGWTHAEAAGIAARQWALPDRFAALIEDHLGIERWIVQSDSEPDRVAVSLSALLPAIDDTAWPEHRLFEKYYEKSKPRCAPSLSELFDKVDREFAEFAPILKLAIPKSSLASRLSGEGEADQVEAVAAAT